MGTFSFLVMSLSFAPPKESNQRTEALKGRARERSEQQESGKDNRVCFSPIAQCHFPLQKTEPGSRLFRVSPRAVLKRILLY